MKIAVVSLLICVAMQAYLNTEYDTRIDALAKTTACLLDNQHTVLPKNCNGD